MWFIAFTVLGGLLFLALAGQLDEAKTLRDWEMALTPEGSNVLSNVAGQVRHERSMAETSYEKASEAQKHGNLDDAVRFLRAGSMVIESCSKTLPELLRNLSILSWQAAAILPAPPLRPLDFKVGQLRTLAGIHTLVHHLLTTTRERFRFRIAVLRYGLAAAVRILLRNTRTLVERPDATPGWERVAAIRADLGILTEETLTSLRVLLGSLAAVYVAPARGPAREVRN